MAVGFPRSVLSGTARHGADIIRRAILQRRRVADSYGGSDTYQNRAPSGQAYLPGPARAPSRGTTPPPSAPAPRRPAIVDPYDQPAYTPPPTPDPYAPVGGDFYDRFAGTGGPGGAFTTKGVWEPYGYGQEPGKTYSGFNTATQWRQAIEGRGEQTMAELNAQAEDILSRYNNQQSNITRRTVKGRENAYEDAIRQMPTYNTLSPGLFDAAYEASGQYAPGVSAPGARDEFGKQPIGFDRPGVAFFQGPQVGGAGTPARTNPGGLFGPKYTAVGPSFTAATPGNTLSAPELQPARPMGSAGLDAIFGAGPPREPVQTRADLLNKLGNLNSLHGWTPGRQPGEPAPAYRTETYNPAADWEQALNATGAARQMRDYGKWHDTEMANIDAEYEQPFADINQMSQITPGEWMQNVAINAYGVDPNVAAGMFNEDWSRDYAREPGEDEMSSFYLDRNLQSLDEFGVPYSEIPEAMTPQQIVTDARAREAIAIHDATGMWPEGYEDALAEQEKAALYGPLNEAFGADANAILQSANMTPEQAGSFLSDGTFQDAYADLLSTVNPDTGTVDEERMVEALRRAYQIDPALARLLETVAPQFAGSDYLIDDELTGSSAFGG